MEDYKIDFSSTIKFNCLIRDMNPANKSPKNAMDNIWVFLKGAPDRVWVRCTSILVEGQPEPLLPEVLTELEASNNKFGNMGERVLGFSRIMLDPIANNGYFNKEKFYDTKKWGEFKDYTEIPPTNAD